MGGLTERSFAAPPVVLPHVVAVVAHKNDNGILAESEPVQFSQDPANAVIRIANGGEVAMKILPALFRRDISILRDPCIGVEVRPRFGGEFRGILWNITVLW